MIGNLNVYETQLEIILKAFNRGLRSTLLDDQPAPWILAGLKILESGKTLTVEDVERFNLAGGTDHPDPWFG